MPEKILEMKKWIKAWQNAAVCLNEVKKKKLRSSDYYEKNRDILDEMLHYACQNAKIRLNSGLAEQQRLFMKLKNNSK
jgi:hypothetical protein